MQFTSEQRLDDGVLERDFILGEIPGVLWTSGSAPAPLILSGHNGGLHKRNPRLAARARHHVAEYGFAVAAIDAPGHGDRPRSAIDEQARSSGQPHTAESACRARQLDLLYYSGFSFVFDVTVDQLAHRGTRAVRPQHDAGRARTHMLRPPEPASQQGGQ
jgi:hypothetical protein